MRSDQLNAAGIIAENVVLALERLDTHSLATLIRGAAIARLMRELVAEMPTRFNGVLTAACNRYLATNARMRPAIAAPRVSVARLSLSSRSSAKTTFSAMMPAALI
ncbi:hypothetical protein [Methylobacterium sp. E-066]|uniref:hypothetical protein n=1 Tax=Methylobacterium sp. E-066 TaxID=2836584 RepID=UPI001FBB2329|nr:hypothetical protein [Methylobacterium sp. E-066]MCJ2138560.1 hypothetical protein [Methylobacterium sp. E-066]